jgi:predicted HD phosphohydrolase
MQQNNINNVLKKIEYLYTVYGQQHYEEKCTQLQHAEQCGTLALQDGLDEEVALAAFLHDVGHFLAEDKQLPEQSAFGYAAHDQLGANFLAECGFSEKIVFLVREHVQVKRYLARVEAGYLSRLSHASTTTLKQQGGPMSATDARIYALTPHLDEIIKLRNIDDSGKQPEMSCKPLRYWLNLASTLLS